MASTRTGWPLVFPLRASTIELLDRADYVYDLSRDIDAPAEAVFERFFDDRLADDVPALQGFHWHTARGQFAGALVDETFTWMSLRLRTVLYEPGRRLAMSIERCSLPLGRQMLECLDATPRGDGCRMRWRIAVRYLPGASVAAPLATPVFTKLFNTTFDAVARRPALAAPPVRSRA